MLPYHDWWPKSSLAGGQLHNHFLFLFLSHTSLSPATTSTTTATAATTTATTTATDAPTTRKPTTTTTTTTTTPALFYSNIFHRKVRIEPD